MTSCDRRSLMKLLAGAAGAMQMTRAARAAEARAPLPDVDRLVRAEKDPNRSLLIRGGVLVSLDPRIGSLAQADLLIRGSRIVEIGTQLKHADVVIDAAGMIVIPGFVDAHRHSWEGQLRRIIPDGELADYYAITHEFFALHYRPSDIYVGNLLTALGCIDAGITCIIDNSHNSRSPEHSDAAIQALVDSGIRGVHASGRPRNGEWSHQWPRDLERLQKQFFASEDQLLTLRMFCSVRFEREEFAWARKLGLRITNEVNGRATSELIQAFAKEQLLGTDNTYNHCTNITDEAWRAIRDTGGNVNVCPRSDTQYGIERGIPALQSALDHGLAPGLSIDNETSYSTDMFTEMRVAFHLQRSGAFERRAAGDAKAPAPISTETLLRCATINGAVCTGLENKIGTLAVGKQADLVLIDTSAINLYPMHHAIGTVVQGADTRNVDTVLIGGRLRKFRGVLIGVDPAAVKRMVDESVSYLLARSGYRSRSVG